MDMADLADRQIETQMQAALAQAIRTPNGGGATHCSECAAPIPPERRRAMPHASTCVHCAAALEMADRNMGKNVGAWWW